MMFRENLFRTNNKIVAYIPQKKGESIDDFIKTTRILKKINIKVPEFIYKIMKLEILLIDDFGNNKISKIIDQNDILKF